MDMISPEGYRMDHESDSWEELLKERSRLLRSLERYELCCDERDDREMCPSASLVYQFELEFLRELCDLTRIAMCREKGEANFFDDEADDGEGEEGEAIAEMPSQERIDEASSQGFNIVDELGNIRYFEGC